MTEELQLLFFVPWAWARSQTSQRPHQSLREVARVLLFSCCLHVAGLACSCRRTSCCRTSCCWPCTCSRCRTSCRRPCSFCCSIGPGVTYRNVSKPPLAAAPDTFLLHLGAPGDHHRQLAQSPGHLHAAIMAKSVELFLILRQSNSLPPLDTRDCCRRDRFTVLASPLASLVS